MFPKEKTTIYYNLLSEEDVMVSLLYFDELRLFLDRVVGSSEPCNYFREVPLD